MKSLKEAMMIREAKKEDLNEWAEMRSLLWPDSADDHLSELEDHFSGTSIDIHKVFVLGHEKGPLTGFLEINRRNFAEGSRQPEVPYVEAWFIREEYRGQGYGKKLMQRAEEWALEQGYSELASDTEVTNHQSIAIHKILGFEETERIVCFLKKLR